MEINKTGGYTSQGKKHHLSFIYEGEIRYGPEYYKIEIDGQLISDRIFGFEFKWHQNSSYLALQEWLTIDYKVGPITALTIVDLTSMKLARVSKADKGFIRPLKFENDLMIFEKHFFELSHIKEYQIKLSEIKNWEV